MDARTLSVDHTAPLGVRGEQTAKLPACLVEGGERQRHERVDRAEVINTNIIMVAIPVMKLFSMTVKTLAKPMSKKIKTGESSSLFSLYICTD